MLLLKLKEKLSKIGYALSDNAQEMLNKIKISGKNKLGKKVAGFVLASAFAIAPISLAACSANCNPLGNIQNTNPDNTTNPEGNTPGGTITPGTPSTPGQTDEHSKIVNNLLHDEYYRNLAYKLANSGEVISKDMLPVPYKFLREEGKDVDAYLNGTLNAFASSYMYDNDKNHLYVSVKAENKSYSEYGNYYTNYVLKYPLTDQESEEYLYLCKGEYLQGLLFIQELDIQKNPEVLSKVNIAKVTYEGLVDLKNAPEINVDKFHTVEVDVLKATSDDFSIDIRCPASSSYIATTKKRTLNIALVSNYAHPQQYDNNVFWYASPTAGDLSFDDYLSSTKNITSFGYGQRILNSNPYYAFSTQK